MKRTLASVVLAAAVVGCGGGSGRSMSQDLGATDGGNGDAGQPLSVRMEMAAVTHPAADEWDISFVLDDLAFPTRTIQRVDDLSALWPLGGGDISSFACDQPPWVAATPKTGTLSLTVFVDGSGASLFASCGSRTGYAQAPGDANNPPDSFLLGADGVLDDGTAFHARGGANVP